MACRQTAGKGMRITPTRTLFATLLTSLFATVGMPGQTPPPINTVIEGDGGDRFAFQISSGDLNHDGLDDLVVGAPHQTGGNKVYVYFGPVDLASIDMLGAGDADVVIVGATNSETGWSVTTGDVLGNEEDDLIIGAPAVGGVNGAVRIFAGPLQPGTYPAVTADLTIDGHTGGYAGWAVAAGDFDGDGKDELAIGANGTGPLGEGEAYLMDCDGGNPPTDTSMATATFAGVGTTGASMANGGDINGDGFEDFLLGSYGALITSGFNFGGTVHIVYGCPQFDPSYVLDDPLSTGIGNITAEFDGHNLGYDVAPAGDVNLDGFDDFLIGAPSFRISNQDPDLTPAEKGSAYLVLGSRDLAGIPQILDSVQVSQVADLIFLGNTVDSRTGNSVACAGFAGATWSRTTHPALNWVDYGPVILIGTGIDRAYSHAYKIDRTIKQVIFGPPVLMQRRGIVIQLPLAATGNFVIQGAAGSRLGMEVHGPVDLDADGLHDIVLGAPHQLKFTQSAGDGQVHISRGQ